MAMTWKAEQTKRRLLESARRLISEKGFDAVSVEDITEDSGVAKGTFYHYFSRKEAVVEEISFTSRREIFHHALTMPGNVEERLAYYFEHILDEAEWSGVRLVRQWLRDVMDVRPGVTKGEDTLRMGFETLRELIEKSVARKELRENTPTETLAKLLQMHIYGILTVWCIADGRWSLEKEAKSFTALHMRLLLAPYRDERENTI